MILVIDAFIRSRIFHWLRFSQFALAVLIFTLAALMPQSQIKDLPTSDHSLHFIGNVLLFLSAWVACKGRMKLAILVALLIPYSLMVELAQWLSPSRHVDSKDMLANISGLFFGLFLAIVIEKLWTNLVRSAKTHSPPSY